MLIALALLLPRATCPSSFFIAASSTGLLQHITDQLHREFTMTDLGDLSYFLEISVSRSTTGMLLFQRQYAIDLLQRAGMMDCNPCVTPIDTRCKLSADDGPLVADHRVPELCWSSSVLNTDTS
jgi:hypothetical protein